MRSLYDILFVSFGFLSLGLICYADFWGAIPLPVILGAIILTALSGLLAFLHRRKLQRRSRARRKRRTVMGMDFGADDGEYTGFVRVIIPLRPMPCPKTSTYQFHDGLTCMRIGRTVLAWKTIQEERRIEDAGA